MSTDTEHTTDDLRELDMQTRKGFLTIIDTLERRLKIRPRTAELRKAYREDRLLVK